MNHFAVHLKLTQHCKSTILQLKSKYKKLIYNQKKKKARMQMSRGKWAVQPRKSNVWWGIK